MHSSSRRSSLALVAFLLLGPALPSAAQDLTELARRSKHSVVALKILDRFGREVAGGSGFFIDPEGLIVTNRHVVEAGSRVQAVLSNQQTLDVAGVMATDEANDLAIVKVGSGPYPALVLADSSSVEAGLPVVVLGNPLGFSSTLSEGIVSAVRAEGNLPEWHDMPVLQITAAISPGSSGSPVMNLDGEVIGVAVSQATRGQNLNFAVPSAAVRALLGSVDVAAAPRPFGAGQIAKTATGAYVRNLVISLVFFAVVFFGYRYLR